MLKLAPRFCAACLLAPILLAAQQRNLRLEPVDASSRQSFEKQVKVALVVGISAYPQGSGLSSLKYAARDADVLGDTLKSQGYLVRRLKDSDATRAVIRRTLRELSDAVAPDEGTLLFFFGGHGYTYKGANYLATFGSTADDLDGEGLAVKDVEALLLASKAKRKLLFVDACRNDPGQASRAAGQRSFETLQASEGIRVLYSTKEGRVSYEDDTLKQGIFTYYLAKGLAGDAAGADGSVTFRDLADYMTNQMRAYTVEKGAVQIPFEAGEASGDFLLSTGTKGSQAPPGTLPQAPAVSPPADRPASDASKAGLLTGTIWTRSDAHRQYTLTFNGSNTCQESAPAASLKTAAIAFGGARLPAYHMGCAWAQDGPSVRVALDVGARADCRVEYVLTLKGDELAGPALYAATGKKKCPAAETLQFQIQKKHIVRPLP